MKDSGFSFEFRSAQISDSYFEFGGWIRALLYPREICRYMKGLLFLNSVTVDFREIWPLILFGFRTYSTYVHIIIRTEQNT